MNLTKIIWQCTKSSKLGERPNGAIWVGFQKFVFVRPFQKHMVFVNFWAWQGHGGDGSGSKNNHNNKHQVPNCKQNWFFKGFKKIWELGKTLNYYLLEKNFQMNSWNIYTTKQMF